MKRSFKKKALFKLCSLSVVTAGWFVFWVRTCLKAVRMPLRDVKKENECTDLICI